MPCSGCGKRRQYQPVVGNTSATTAPRAGTRYKVTFPDGSQEFYGSPIPARRRAATGGGTVEEVVPT